MCWLLVKTTPDVMYVLAERTTPDDMHWLLATGREIRNCHYGQLPQVGVGRGLGRGLCPLPRC